VRIARAFAAVAAGALLLPAFASATSTKSAVVSDSGALVRGNGATGAIHLAHGAYEVDFDSDVSGCAYVASPGDTGAGFVRRTAFATTAPRSGNRNGVFVQSIDVPGDPDSDEPFHLSVFCGSARLWASVKSDGSTARGANVVNSTRLAAGQYEVVFDRDVHRCVFTATIGTPGPIVPHLGTITVAGSATTNDGVLVQTLNAAGVSADMPFYLEVTCRKASWWGVINGDGTTARASRNETGSHLVAPGQYEVDFDRDVSGCVYVATIGEPASAGPIDTPMTITTATRATAPDAVLVFVHERGGWQSEPFHLNVVCS
jgi:hypothetical protein